MTLARVLPIGASALIAVGGVMFGLAAVELLSDGVRLIFSGNGLSQMSGAYDVASGCVLGFVAVSGFLGVARAAGGRADYWRPTLISGVPMLVTSATGLVILFTQGRHEPDTGWVIGAASSLGLSVLAWDRLRRLRNDRPGTTVRHPG